MLIVFGPTLKLTVDAVALVAGKLLTVTVAFASDVVGVTSMLVVELLTSAAV